jgi:hypothetical protein
LCAASLHHTIYHYTFYQNYFPLKQNALFHTITGYYPRELAPHRRHHQVSISGGGSNRADTTPTPPHMNEPWLTSVILDIHGKHPSHTRKAIYPRQLSSLHELQHGGGISQATNATSKTMPLISSEIPCISSGSL